MGDFLSILFVILAILLMVPDSKKKKQQQQRKRQEGQQIPQQRHSTAKHTEKDKRSQREISFPSWMGPKTDKNEQPAGQSIPGDEEYWPEDEYHGSIENGSRTAAKRKDQNKPAGDEKGIYANQRNGASAYTCQNLKKYGRHASPDICTSEDNTAFKADDRPHSDVNSNKSNALALLMQEVGTKDPLAYAMLMSEILQPPLSKRERIIL